MEVAAWLREAQTQLEAAGIATARLDILILLEDVSGKDRAWLLAHPEFKLLSNQVTKLQKLLNRRAQHEPLAYIRGRTEFYGREFVLTPAVLEPRPESETMIDVFKNLPLLTNTSPNNGSDTKKTIKTVRVADVGTGSGALGITAALEVPKVTVDLLDIDPKALKVAKMNVDIFTLTAKTAISDLLASTSTEYDVLLCNLPYVPDDYEINRAAVHEPVIAIFGGPDGLDLYRKLFEQVALMSKQPLYILTEALPPQHMVIELIANQSGYQLLSKNDFIQAFERIQKLSSES